MRDLPPLVSIIIPSYNHARFLPDALAGVLVQTEPRWEALVVDDGSTDNTTEVMTQYTDPRIRYIYQENRGLSGARNTGLQAARGELIALLDADDTWEPTFLAEMAALLDAQPQAGAAYCGFRYMGDAGQSLPGSACRVVAPEQFRAELLKGNWLSPCSVVVRQNIYRQVGGFDVALRACEDYDMWLRISDTTNFVGIPRMLVNYRRLGNNMSDDPDRMRNAREMVLGRHLGSLETPPEHWSEGKRRAVRQIYSSALQGYLAQGRAAEGADALDWLLRYQPDFAHSLELWYSLACVHQLVGQRGDPATWDAAQAERDLTELLGALERQGWDRTTLDRLGSQAWFALARLLYNSDRKGPARQMLGRSLRSALRLPEGGGRAALGLRLLPGAGTLRRSVKHAETGTQ